MNLGIFIWMFNEEYLIRLCVESILRVFPSVQVYDIGSTDNSVDLIKDLVKVNKLGRLGGKEYIEIKREIHSNYDYVFNVDGDEIYPKSSLLFLKNLIQKRPPRIHGFWRLVNRDDQSYLISSPYNRGEVAWDTTWFELRRVWPNEVLKIKAYKATYPEYIPYDEVFCWHGLFLDRSPKYSRSREKKRISKLKKFSVLNWSRIELAPWMKNKYETL